ncbi:MAG: MCE family protein [Deltaproteobacteria bacterium]|nr:MCE family protein [Deltaproteobacteria bacterium]
MPKRFSSAAIGMFVIGSIVLIVGALAVLGSGSLFKRPHRFICFFQGSLNGLNVGAAVKVRGVAIGSVSEIHLRLQPSEGQIKVQNSALQEIPVVIEIDESQLKAKGATGEALRPEELNALIEGGLRAQLETESLLTGLLYVEIDLHPGTPVKLVLEPGSGPYPEIPTIPTEFQQAQEKVMEALDKLGKVDIAKLTQSITDAGNAASNLLNSPDLKATLAALQTTTRNLNISLQTTTRNLDRTLGSIRGLAENLNNRGSPLLVSLKKASDQASVTLTQMSSTIAELQTTLAPDAPLAYRLDVALENFAEASSAIRDLTDYLQRNPSAIVRGRYVSHSQ